MDQAEPEFFLVTFEGGRGTSVALHAFSLNRIGVCLSIGVVLHKPDFVEHARGCLM